MAMYAVTYKRRCLSLQLFFFARMSFVLLQQVLWPASVSLTAKARIFTGLMHRSHPKNLNMQYIVQVMTAINAVFAGSHANLADAHLCWGHSC